MAAPRLRQLRRDKTIFSLSLNIIRLHLEEQELLRQPQAEAPEAVLLLVQQSIDHWVGLATGYLMRKHRCPAGEALPLLGEFQADLKASIPAAEVWQIPLGTVLFLPPELLASHQPAAAEVPEAASDLAAPAPPVA
ncbi:MAG: hypothetical protein EOO56_24025 [Hymenobacter sp.]|nr:MAG: hypothetical protein EOO56_24025 [Hymenobacter sp.]